MMASDILSRTLTPSEQAIESRVGEETVLLHLENADYCGLDATGTRIWELLKDGSGPAAICRVTADDHAVPMAQVEDDARRFLADLLAHSIVIAE